MLSGRADDEALAFVLFDLAAMFANECFELSIVEPATGDHKRGWLVCPGRQRGNDVIDIRLDVDAGVLLELALTLFVLRHGLFQPRTKVRIHDPTDVGVSDDRCVDWDV